MPRRRPAELLCAVVVTAALAACGPAEPTAALRAPPDFPGSAAATEWNTQGDAPPGYGADGPGYASPRALLDALIAEFGPDLAAGDRSLTGYLLGEDGQGGAVAVLHAVGGQDDSVAGDEVQLSMRPGADGRWRIVGARVRTHCRRDVAEGACV
jgi:hypothetical protein